MSSSSAAPAAGAAREALACCAANVGVRAGGKPPLSVPCSSAVTGRAHLGFRAARQVSTVALGDSVRERQLDSVVVGKVG